MHTDNSRLAGGILEATLSVALLTVPLFFNPYSARMFEGEKAALIWLLMGIAAVVAVVHYLSGRVDDEGGVGRRILGRPVVGAALLLLVVAAAATATSIAPRWSLWGSYHRAQGVVTLVSYLVLFGVAIYLLRQSDRRDRLLATLVAASAPIAIFAILQYLNLSPVPWRAPDPTRVSGTLSNPIFLGSYLVMVVPLTLAQLVRLWAADGSGNRPARLAYGLLLGLQVLAVLLSRSQGPWLGLGAVVFFFALFVTLRRGQRDLALGLLLVVALGLIFLTVLNLPNSPLASLRSLPGLSEMAQIVSAPSARVRLLIWQSIADRLAGDPQRLVLGYGPDTTQAALLPAYPAELRHLEQERLPDRAHSAFMEALISTGLLGLAALTALFGAIIHTGLRALGWLPTPAARNRWLIWTLVGLALGLAVPRLLSGGWAFSGVGAALGLAAGLVVYLVVSLPPAAPGGPPALTVPVLLSMAVLAALVGHLLEISVGIRVTATEVVFWTLAGLLLAVRKAPLTPTLSPLRGEGAGDGRSDDEGRRLQREGRGEGGIALVWHSGQGAIALLAGLMLSTLSFGVFLIGSPGGSSLVLQRALLLVGAWLLVWPLWSVAPGVERPRGSGWIFPVLSLAWAGLFLALHVLVRLAGGDAITLLNVYYIWVLISLAAVGALLWRQTAVRAGMQRSWRAILAPVVGAVSAAVILWLIVGGLYADVYLGTAEAAASAGQWREALAFYQQAANTAPTTDLYHQKLGEGYVAAAAAADPSQRDALFQAAEQAFRRALDTHPAEGTHRFNLAHLYLLWSQNTADPARQATLLEQAARTYEMAAELMPHDPRVLNEWGLVLQAQGEEEAAVDKYRTAMRVDPQDAEAYLHLGGVYQRSGKVDLARETYQQAAELDPNLAEAHLALADLYRQGGRLMDAVAAQQRAARLWPTDYRIHQNLALLYRDAGQIQNAVAEARLALNYAPPERQAALQSFLQSLLASESP